jgi:hypothetical protein
LKDLNKLDRLVFNMMSSLFRQAGLLAASQHFDSSNSSRSMRDPLR